MTKRSSGTLALTADLRDRLLALEAAMIAPAPRADAAREVVDEALRAVADLEDAPVTRKAVDGPIEATRRFGHVVAAGPELLLTAGGGSVGGNRAVRLAAGSAMWVVDAAGDGERRVRVSVEGEVVADWTWTPAGDVVDNTDREAALAVAAAELTEAMHVELPDLGPISPPTADGDEDAQENEDEGPPAEERPDDEPWAPTHTVGDEPLAVGGVVTGTLSPGTTLAARLPVRCLETTAEGWALVECENGWRCYVDPRGLRPASPGRTTTTATFAVEHPVEGRTAGGDPLWLVPGERYPLGEESGGWRATEVDGTQVWVPSWATRGG